jgi:hypothetical protein
LQKKGKVLFDPVQSTLFLQFGSQRVLPPYLPVRHGLILLDEPACVNQDLKNAGSKKQRYLPQTDTDMRRQRDFLHPHGLLPQCPSEFGILFMKPAPLMLRVDKDFSGNRQIGKVPG